MHDVTIKEFTTPILLSVKVAFLSSLIVFAIGLLVAWIMTKRCTELPITWFRQAMHWLQALIITANLCIRMK